MSNAIEIEAKVLVKEEDYLILKTAYKDYPSYTQTNYYIDNESRELAKEGIALRVREKNGSYEMTLKTPLSQGLLEKNQALSKEQFLAYKEQGVFPKCDLVRFLTMLGFDVSKLKILTYLTTERIDVEVNDGLLSIDKNVYSGKTDYEVEFEYNNMEGAKHILKSLLAQNGVAAPFTKATKVHRAMAAIGK